MSNAFTSRFNLYPDALAVQAGDGDLFHRHADHRRKDNEGVGRRDEQFDFKFPIMYTVGYIPRALVCAAGIRSCERRVGGNQRQTERYT